MKYSTVKEGVQIDIKYFKKNFGDIDKNLEIKLYDIGYHNHDKLIRITNQALTDMFKEVDD